MKLDEFKPGTIFKDGGGFKYIKTAYETNGGIAICVTEYDGKITLLPLNSVDFKQVIDATPEAERLHDVAYRALKTWEEDEQLRQAMEEAGEFIVECSKVIREGNEREEINGWYAYVDALKRLREEAADMLIMLEQVKQITRNVDDKSFEDVLNEKIDKLEKEIKDVDR